MGATTPDPDRGPPPTSPGAELDPLTIPVLS
jgi:hypothetical protein